MREAAPPLLKQIYEFGGVPWPKDSLMSTSVCVLDNWGSLILDGDERRSHGITTLDCDSNQCPEGDCCSIR